MRALLMTLCLITVLYNPNSNAAQPDWSDSVSIPLGETRENIYELPANEFADTIAKGYEHALHYPVTVSGLYIPYDPVKRFIETPGDNALKRLLQKITHKRMQVKTLEEMYQWLGLNPFPSQKATGIFRIEEPAHLQTDGYMGATIRNTKQGRSLTFSCATCHTSTLFGKPIMGLTNRRMRANKFFHMAKQTIPLVPSPLFKTFTGATEAERQMFRRTKYNLPSVAAIVPLVQGLDTSLPQVALSLARRGKDEDATKSKFYQRFPRKNKLDKVRADSKPMPWWNLKYKTRWLADGSITAGNPIFTNFLWNELGRGTDLVELLDWMKKNKPAIKELTAAAFATKAPHWTDFFPVDTIDVEKAKRGQKMFNTSCKKCHGEYEKGWNQFDADFMPESEQVKTTNVYYHEKTPVKDVGTDPLRYQGTKYFAQALNDLKISQYMKTVVEPQKGYVPPPLVGIFARYPYFHNNSIPNLCALVTPPKQRPTTWVQGPSNNSTTDYDSDCLGYPVGSKMPKSWLKDKEATMDTRRKGLSNSGHYRMLLHKDGSEKYTWDEKMELLEFLKTL
jgi:cytochrome c2